MASELHVQLPVAIAAMLLATGCQEVFRLDEVSPPGKNANWAVLQKIGATASDTPPTFRVGKLAQGSLVVVAIWMENSTSIRNVTDDKGNTYTRVPGAEARNYGEALDIWYAAGTIGEATGIDVDATAGGLRAATIWEVSDYPTATIDASGTSSASLIVEPVGPELETSVAGAFIVSFAIVQSMVNGTVDGDEFEETYNSNGNSWVQISSNQAPAAIHQAHWRPMLAQGYSVASGVAFLR